MSLVITTLKHHRQHIVAAMEHYGEIEKLETDYPDSSVMRDLAIENHDDLMRWELQQAADAVQFCHAISSFCTKKRQHIARIASNRMLRMTRQVQGVSLP